MKQNNSRVTLTLHADISANDVHKFMQHIRDFDAAHPRCHFEILADAPGLSLDQCMALLRVDPELTFFKVLPTPKRNAG